MGATDELLDTFGRVATDLRVSLTDRCNLRCSYCMPPEGLDWLPGEQVLTDDELIRLITIAVRDLGIEEVRFTGGEPLLRKSLEQILAATTALRTRRGEVPTTALTTNGLGLARRAAGLVAAGLHRINVSLDSLDRERFARITHRDRIDDVFAGLRAASEAGLSPLKVNAVLVRGVNDDEAVDLLRWAVAEGYQLRFIEQMPLDPQGAWDRDPDDHCGRDPDQAPGRVRAAAHRPGCARGGTGRDLGGWRRSGPDAVGWPGHGGHHRLGDPAVLRRLRPHQVDRRRPGTQLPVRPYRDRPARRCCAPGRDDLDIAEAWRTAMWGKAPGTASTTRRSCSRTVR